MPETNEAAPRPLPAPLTLACGLLMGGADAVPGVSGGTIALIVGVYERFVESLHVCIRFPWLLRDARGRARLLGAIAFLVPLGIGMAAAYFLGTRLLAGPSDAPGLLRRPETAPYCYAFFFGLVLFSVQEPWGRIPRPGWRSVVVLVAGAALTLVLLGLEKSGREPETWMLLYGGALAVAVMLLPGISGSLLLLVLGQYTAVTAALHDFDLPRLGVFGLGILLGLALFVPVLRYLLRRHHDLTMAALAGFMLGSLYALWPWKTHYDLKSGGAAPIENIGVAANWPGVLAVAVAGVGAAWLLTRLHRAVDRASA